MVFDDVFDEELGGLVGGGVGGCRNEVYHFGGSVGEDEDSIVGGKFNGTWVVFE